MKFVTLRLYYSKDLHTNLSLRHIIADTIEQRNWAIVIEEGSGNDYFDLMLSLNGGKLNNEIIELVKSFGFYEYKIFK